MSGPSSDPFDSLLNPNIRNDISSFVASYYNFSLLSIRPLYYLQTRLRVTAIGLNKAGMPVEHESLAVWVTDDVTHQNHEFVIERMPSKIAHSDRFSTFCKFPDSDDVLKSITTVIRKMKSMTSQVAESISAALEAERAESEAIPLLPLMCDMDPSPPFSYASDPSPPSPPITSIIDSITTSLAQAVAVARAASGSFSPQSLAADTISGLSPGKLNRGRCIRQFEPSSLSLFDLVLLSQVVHDYAPIYGLFDNQCYMFASVIFDSIVQIYSVPHHHPDYSSNSNATRHFSAPSQEVGAPENCNVVILPSPNGPDPAGRWSRLLIVDPTVKTAIVQIVGSRYTIQRAEYKAKIDEAEASCQARLQSG